MSLTYINSNTFAGKNINFTARIPDNIRTLLYHQMQTTPSRPKLKKLLDAKIKDVESWGTEDFVVVRTKNPKGNYCLGLSVPLTSELRVSAQFNGIKGRTELSQFLALTAAHLMNTEITISNLYKKYGFEIFKKR